MVPPAPRHRTALFHDRIEAGHALASALHAYAGREPVVLALPRGGVVLGFEVAKALRAELDILIVCKVGAPLNEEVGIGAVAEGGVVVEDTQALEALGVPAHLFAQGVARAEAEVERRVGRYRAGKPPVNVRGRIVILVDDGIATGVTARAAARAARAMGARTIVLAAPVGAKDSVEAIEREVDHAVVLARAKDFGAVGNWYRDFDQVTDEEVVSLLAHAGTLASALAGHAVQARSVRIPVEGLELQGELAVPPRARGLIIFAHGASSGRRSPRNIQVAAELNRAGFATLLFDMLTAREAADETLTGQSRFDIPVLSARLQAVTRWACLERPVRGLPVGYFGDSTGAGAALTCAATGFPPVDAVVSRGRRPDLAAIAVEAVTVPTLLIVGGDDHDVLAANRQALGRLSGPRHLHVVTGAGHLFEEAGALEEVARTACAWFESHMVTKRGEPRGPAATPWGDAAS